jgi:uncharacterized protein (DUF779 family)
MISGFSLLDLAAKQGEKMQKNRLSIIVSVTLITLLLSLNLSASDWKHRPGMFNPSGVPSLSFSQPRFADMDADGDMDMILGSTQGTPVYITNTGSATSPKFTIIDDLFASINETDAEVAVAYDIDADGDLDLVTGGFNGLQLYENTGNAVAASFTKVDGFFSGLTPVSNPVPDLGDIDNDGDLDLVVGFSESGEVKVYTNSGSDTLAVFLESSARTLGDLGLYAYPVFCDPDGDGDLDILCGRDGTTLVYYQNNGSATAGNWGVNASPFNGIAGSTYFNSPAMVDINGDGKQDLIYGNYNGPLTYYRNSGTTSSPAWTVNNTLFGGTIDIGGASTPFFFDHDGDGDMDIYTGSNLGDIKLLQNNGTATAATFKYLRSLSNLKHSLYSFVSIANTDADSYPDALVGDFNGTVYYHVGTSNGFVGSAYAVPLIDVGDWAAPRFVDMDFDGDQDIVIGNSDGLLCYLENQGSQSQPLWSEISNYFGGLDVGNDCVPAFADLDFDGDLDMVAGIGSREIHYYENVDGAWVEDTTVVSEITVGQNAAPAFADLDGDGDQDLVIGNYEGNFDYYENLREVVAVKPETSLPDHFDLSAYPNPFNPSTAISFTLPVAGTIDLSIFDITGREVANLLNAYKAAGSHKVHFSAGQDLSTGIYFCRLALNGKVVQTMKLTLLK